MIMHAKNNHRYHLSDFVVRSELAELSKLVLQKNFLAIPRIHRSKLWMIRRLERSCVNKICCVLTGVLFDTIRNLFELVVLAVKNMFCFHLNICC